MEETVVPTVTEIFLPALGVVVFWLGTVRGFKEGVVSIKRSEVKRSEAPKTFWVSMAFEVFCFVVCLLITLGNIKSLLLRS